MPDITQAKEGTETHRLYENSGIGFGDMQSLETCKVRSILLASNEQAFQNREGTSEIAQWVKVLTVQARKPGLDASSP